MAAEETKMIDTLKKARDAVGRAAELILNCPDAEYERRHREDFERLLSGLNASIDELAVEDDEGQTTRIRF
jgi:hypothetical protein